MGDPRSWRGRARRAASPLAALFVGAALVAAACEGRGAEPGAPRTPAPAAPAVPPLAQPAPSPSGAAPAESPAPSAPPGEPLAGAQLRREARAPARGCVLVTPRPLALSSTISAPALRGDGGEFVAAWVSRGARGEAVELARVTPGQSQRRVASVPVPTAAKRSRFAPPAILPLADGAVALALSDGDGRMRYTEVSRAGRAADWITLGEHADERFAAALAALGEARDGTGLRLVAWTRVERGQVRLELARVRAGALVDRRDASPAGMGGAAPVFVATPHAADASGGQVLIFLDPREGTSPVVRAEVGPSGELGPPEVLRPVGTAPGFPGLAAAHTQEDLFIAYAAIGAAATTAIGLFTARTKDSPPVPLLRGLGYGVLRLDAVAGPKRAVFAFEVPRDRSPEGPRDVHLTLADAGGVHAPLVIGGDKEGLRAPALARLAGGTVGLAYAGPGGVQLALASCDD